MRRVIKLTMILWICAVLFTMARAVAQAPAPADELNKKMDEANKLLADATNRVVILDGHVTTVQTMLSWVTALGTIMALVIGTTAYLNLQNIQKSAAQELARFRKEMQDGLDEVRADFPAISDLNHKLTRIVDQMAAGNIPSESLDESTFEKYGSAERGRLAVLESVFNAITLFDMEKVPDSRSAIAKINAKLGHFYAAWHLSAPTNILAFDQALVYLGRALDSGSKDLDPAIRISVRLARGVVYVWRSAALDAALKMEMSPLALADYQSVLELDPNNPRALLGVAYLYDDQSKLAEAISNLDKILDRKPRVAEQRVVEIAYGNRALYRVKNGELDKAMADFWALRSLVLNPNDHNRFETYVQAFDQEEKKGALDKLFASPDHKKEFDNFKDPNFKRP